MDERLHLSLPQERNLRITKKYRDITLNAIAAKVYNVLLRNPIQPKINENSQEKLGQPQRFLQSIESSKKYGQTILRQH